MPAPVANRRGGRGLHTQRGRTSQSTRRKREALPEYLSAIEVAMCIQEAPQSVAAMALSIMWRLGLRVSEAAGLKFSDIDTAGAVAKVRHGKGDKPRMIPVHSALAERLALYCEVSGRKSGYVIGGSIRPSYTRRTISFWAKDSYNRAVALDAKHDKTLIRSGLRVSAHTFRHSAARHWLANNVPLNQVSAWLGHSDLDTTYRYLKILPDTMGSMDKVP